MNRPQEIALVCGHELSRAVRSPKAAILFLLYALVASFSGFIFIHVTGAFDEQLDALRMRDLVEQMGVYRKAVLLFFGEGAADQAWLFQMPPLTSSFQVTHSVPSSTMKAPLMLLGSSTAEPA